MFPPLESNQLRRDIAALDPIEKKVLGGMIVLMISNHQKIKDREWVAENFTRLSVAALELAQEGDVDEDLDRVKAFVRGHMDKVLNLAFPLFSQVAMDLQSLKGFTLEDACRRAMEYVGGEVDGSL